MIIPVINLFTGSFQTEEGGRFTWENYLNFFKYPSYWRSFSHSILIGLISAVGAIIVGVPLGFMVARWNVIGKPLIITLSTLPLMLPTFIAAFAWIILLGRGGIITKYIETLGHPDRLHLRIPGDDPGLRIPAVFLRLSDDPLRV